MGKLPFSLCSISRDIVKFLNFLFFIDTDTQTNTDINTTTRARTGVTTTEGVYIDGQRIMEGDCTGYRSARAVLTSPEVDFAVLETARGGILKRGLAYDKCDVSVVLNISSDHLGLDGVDTVEELAKVKAVVAQRASRAVVLNAEDDYCVAMAAQLRDGVDIIYFSLDPENTVLLRHLENGGRAVYLQDMTLVLANGARHEALVDARQMPVSLGGAARYNIANALAAAAALAAHGFGNLEIADGLRSFVSDAKHNPMRSNLFDVDGVKVIVDYDSCASTGSCMQVCPEVFEVRNDGYLYVLQEEPAPELHPKVIEAADLCPTGAITVED